MNHLVQPIIMLVISIGLILTVFYLQNIQLGLVDWEMQHIRITTNQTYIDSLTCGDINAVVGEGKYNLSRLYTEGLDLAYQDFKDLQQKRGC